jgi:SNF2 family DNA or RNA helicase
MLWRHQEDAIAWAAGRDAVLLNHEMGTGKTRTALEMIRRAGGTRILVCCPKAVIPAWAKQANLWYPGLRVVMLDRGTSAAKAKVVEAALADTSPCLLVCNYESAWRIASLEKVEWDWLVWDEVHRLKSPSGKASRWARRMCKLNHRRAKRVGLSGTMIPHSILDAWGVWSAVEYPLATWHGSYTIHKAHHAVLAPGQQFVIAYRNLEEAHAKVAATAHRVRAKDVLDLPRLQKLDVAVDLSAAEARVYRELEREFCADVERGTVTPKNALELLLRLQQVCGGFVRLDNSAGATKIAPTPAKGTALSDMLEDLPRDEPVVVFCRFRSDIESARAAAAALGRTSSELSGSRNELAQWQQGDTSVLLCQIQSGGVGIDLTRAAYAVFFSLGYSLSDYEQAVARVHRPGQERPCFVYHLIATIDGRSTVDGRVYDALSSRKKVLDVIIDGYRHAPASAR